MERQINSDDICSGRCAILEFTRETFNVTHWATIRRWIRRGMPAHRMRNGYPFILKTEVISWHFKKRANK